MNIAANHLCAATLAVFLGGWAAGAAESAHPAAPVAGAEFHIFVDTAEAPEFERWIKPVNQIAEKGAFPADHGEERVGAVGSVHP